MIPSEWRKSAVVPIPKKIGGGVCKMDEYRGIMFGISSIQGNVQYHPRKVHTGDAWEKGSLVAEEQGGFRKGRGCRDQLLTC